MKELAEIYNIRFWLFCIIAFSPLWIGIVGCGIMWIKEIAYEVLFSGSKSK